MGVRGESAQQVSVGERLGEREGVERFSIGRVKAMW